MEKVLVALSGGVDSVAVVVLLKKAGYEVEAVTFDILGDEATIGSAEELAGRLGVKWRVEDVRSAFKNHIKDYFIDGYMRGETPAPCSVCNPLIKWAALLRIADKEGFDRVATGHYCRIVKYRGLYYVSTAKDPVKDQSYYLWRLGQEALSRAVTPLGDYTKAEIREMMSGFGFGEVSSKKESMGVCFLGKGGYAAFLEENVRVMPGCGEVIDTFGSIIGSHKGFPYYTIGQKRGFEVNTDGDHYVINIDSAHNRITVGDISRLYTHHIILKDHISADPDELISSDRLTLKVRGIGINPEGYCTAAREGGLLNISVPSGVYAPANGQPAALYIDDRVVGGGVVTGVLL